VRLPRHRSGLRGRLLIALVATSTVTLLAASAALLPPLQDRLRTQRADDLTAATETDALGFERAIEQSLARTRREPDATRRFVLQQDVQSRALILRQRTGARVLVTDAVPQPVYDTDNDAPFPQRLVLRSLIDEEDARSVTDEAVTVAVQLLPALAASEPLEYDRFLLVTQKPLTDVDAAVAQVRNAFLAAAGVGLVVALVLGIALSSTLSRRLARLRAAAVRVAAEGPDAPPPTDTGRDEVGDLARTLATMQEELRRQEAARRAFVATASHELRTPLTSLQGTLELLDEDLRDGHMDPDDLRSQVAGAQSQLGRLRRLATELLDLSRLDAQVPLRAEPVELGELCRAVGAEFELTARDHAVALDVVAPPGPCWAAGDPDAVARVVRILLDNALRYSPTEGRVRVTPAYHGGWATVEVTDEGTGVAAEDRERIFARFQRGASTPGTGKGGFGLGLAIGRELATRMGGTLDLQDRSPGQGACFLLRLHIELPAGSHHADQAAEPAAQPR
jgi:signal transduction histidine kinase